jgi:hypothetical protein
MSKFKLLKSSIPGVFLKVDPKVPFEASGRIVKKFYQLALDFFSSKNKVEKEREKQEKLKEEIVVLAKKYGLRGVKEKKKFDLSVFPRETTDWNLELLKKALGDAYYFVVTEENLITVSIPGFKKEILEKLKQILINFGIPTETIKEETICRINEEKLSEVIENKKIKLPPGTKISKVSWVVTTV